MPFGTAARRLLLGTAPLALTLLLLLLLLGGSISLGGGEKDILVAIPFVAWSVFYLVCFIALWAKGKGLRASAVTSSWLATGLLLAALLLLLVLVKR